MTTSVDTLEQSAQLQAMWLAGRRALLEYEPTPWLLHEWIWNVLGIWIPKQPVCDNHNAPFEVFFDRFFDIVTKTIFLGARTVGKSHNAGLECWMKARFKPGWEARILGGSFEQSQKSHEATVDFWAASEDIGGKDVLEKPPTTKETVFKNGAKYKILTASVNSARGPHPAALFLDEIDVMPLDVFHASLNQPLSRPGRVASWGFCSTRHVAGGIMEDWVDGAEERGYKVYTSCILEAMCPCSDYSCSTCDLDKWCQGKMKPAMEEAYKEQIHTGLIKKGQEPWMGYNTVQDVIDKVKHGSIREDSATGMVQIPVDIDAELFCLRPSRSGLVFSEFEMAQHTYAEGDIKISESWKRYRTFDFGYTNPFVCLFIAADPTDRLYVYDEIYVTGKTTHQMAPIVSARDDKHGFAFNSADISGPNEIATLAEFGIRCWAHRVPIRNGIESVRNALRLRPDGRPGLLINRTKCPFTVHELSKGYRYDENKRKEEPVDANNHSCKALAYFFAVKELGPPRSRKAKVY